MKKLAITSILVMSITCNVQAQEMVMDSINRDKFTGIHQAGDMGQFVYIPYFTTNKSDKKNFAIRLLNAQTFSEEQNLRFELPGTYSLMASAYNGNSYLLYFYNETGKEDIFVTTNGENIVKKKTSKHTGVDYSLFGNVGPEDFVIVSTDNKGNYSARKVGIDLENKWERKSSSPSGIDRQIVSIRNNMGRLEVVRKDSKSGNKYEFSTHHIQMDSGEDIAQNVFKHGDEKLYPTFFSEKDGMNFTGGYYYTDGVYSKQPLGVFFAVISPEGTIEQIAQVPYSQVIEDLKNTVGPEIARENTAIIFTNGYMAHETQQFVMAGQVMTRQDGENISTINFDDFISIKFSIEHQSYKGASSTKYDGSQIELKGNLSNTNSLDLGIWMNSLSLLPFSHFVNMPGNPVIAYKDYGKDGQVNICFRLLGAKNDTTSPECVMLFRERQNFEPYLFSGKLTEKPVQYFGIIPSEHDFGNVTTYELTKNLLLIARTPLPRLDKFMRPLTPEEMGQEDPNQDKPDQTEQPK